MVVTWWIVAVCTVKCKSLWPYGNFFFSLSLFLSMCEIFAALSNKAHDLQYFSTLSRACGRLDSALGQEVYAQFNSHFSSCMEVLGKCFIPCCHSSPSIVGYLVKQYVPNLSDWYGLQRMHWIFQEEMRLWKNAFLYQRVIVQPAEIHFVATWAYTSLFGSIHLRLWNMYGYACIMYCVWETCVDMLIRDSNM